MRILLTGGAGYVGSHVAIELLRTGHDVALLDDFSNAPADSVGRIEMLSGVTRLRVERMDIRDTGACTRLLVGMRPDVVIHLAGLKDVAESIWAPDRYLRTNVGGTAALLRAMDHAGCARLVFSSSAAVYGNPDYLPMDENHRMAPQSPYGRSKLLAETEIRRWVATDPQRGAVALRYFNPVGCLQDDGRRLALSCGGDALMNRIADVADGVESGLAVFGNDYDTPDGTCLRDYIHVTDVALSHVAALHALSADLRGFRAINIGTGRAVSVLEVARLFQECTGRPIPLAIASRRPGDVAASCAAVDKARTDLGWVARHGLDDMCRSVWCARQAAQNRTGTEYSTARYGLS